MARKDSFQYEKFLCETFSNINCFVWNKFKRNFLFANVHKANIQKIIIKINLQGLVVCNIVIQSLIIRIFIMTTVTVLNPLNLAWKIWLFNFCIWLPNDQILSIKGEEKKIAFHEIKPNSILRCDKRQIKNINFGCSRLCSAEGREKNKGMQPT